MRHYPHVEVSVMKVIKRMKERAITDTTVSIKVIHEQEFKVLTSLGIKIPNINWWITSVSKVQRDFG